MCIPSVIDLLLQPIISPTYFSTTGLIVPSLSSLHTHTHTHTPPPPPSFTDIQCDAPGATVSSLAHLQTITSIPGCNHVFGDLQIGYPNCLLPCQLSDFTALNGITMITGSLRISCCSLITDLSDFNSLTTITGSLELYYNQELTRISGFQSLTTVGGSIQISQHPKLQVVTGLSTLSTITGFLTVERNTALYDLEGFSGLITIRGNDIQSGHALSLLYNTNITSLSAFRSLVTVAYGTVHIEGMNIGCSLSHMRT